MPDGEVPGDLRNAFNSQQLRRMEAIAETLMSGLLARRSQERPSGVGQEVQYPQGTRDFGELHQFDEPQALVVLLDWVTQRLTAGEHRRWYVAMADPATCSTIGDGTNQIMLYPGDINVSGMTEVPPEVRIFRLLRQPPYAVMELAPFTPERIADERAQQTDPLLVVINRWNTEGGTRHRKLLARLRAELERQEGTLDPEVAAAVRSLIAQSRTIFEITEAFEAASYLGILSEVTSGFEQPA